MCNFFALLLSLARSLYRFISICLVLFSSVLCTNELEYFEHTNGYCHSAQMNKKQPELQRFIRLSIVLSKCDTTAHKIQTICIVLNATISFIDHWRYFFLIHASPAPNSFHFRNDLVAEHAKCFNIRSTAKYIWCIRHSKFSLQSENMLGRQWNWSEQSKKKK